MTETIIGLFVATAAIIATAMRIRRMRAIHEFRFGPHLHDRIMVLFDPFVGQSLSVDQLQQLELESQQLFVDVLTGVGLVPTGWRIQVASDDVVGPTPHVVGPSGEQLTLAEFEVRLRDRRIELEAA